MKRGVTFLSEHRGSRWCAGFLFRFCSFWTVLASRWKGNSCGHEIKLTRQVLLICACSDKLKIQAFAFISSREFKLASGNQCVEFNFWGVQHFENAKKPSFLWYSSALSLPECIDLLSPVIISAWMDAALPNFSLQASKGAHAAERKQFKHEFDGGWGKNI